jgi:hypothetical protein
MDDELGWMLAVHTGIVSLGTAKYGNYIYLPSNVIHQNLNGQRQRVTDMQTKYNVVPKQNHRQRNQII